MEPKKEGVNKPLFEEGSITGEIGSVSGFFLFKENEIGSFMLLVVLFSTEVLSALLLVLGVSLTSLLVLVVVVVLVVVLKAELLL